MRPERLDAYLHYALAYPVTAETVRRRLGRVPVTLDHGDREVRVDEALDRPTYETPTDLFEEVVASADAPVGPETGNWAGLGDERSSSPVDERDATL